MFSYSLGSMSVSRVGFGAMQLPGPGASGPPRDRDAALAVLRRAVELGQDLGEAQREIEQMNEARRLGERAGLGGIRRAHSVERLASMSRVCFSPFRSVSTFSFRVSPSTVPV